MINRNGTRILALTQSYWLTGDLRSANERVQETFKSGSSNYVTMHAVTVSHSSGTDPVAVDLPEVLLPKPMVELIVIPGDDHEAPEKRRNHLVRKIAFDTFLVAADHSIRGTLHLSVQATDALRVITSLVDDFVALTDVTLTPPSGQRRHAGVVLVNRNCISCLSVQRADEKRVAASGSSETLPEGDQSPLDRLLQIPGEVVTAQSPV